MAIDALVKPFLFLPLFQGLKPLQLTEIVRRADRIVYRPGDTIIEEDQTGDAAIVIISGEALRVSDLAPGEAAETIVEGSMIGEMAMLIETVHSATIVARTTVRALRLTREEMHNVMEEDPQLAEHLTDKITSRLQRIADELRTVDDAFASIADFESAFNRSFDPHAPTPTASHALTYTAAPLH
jgi:CRP-like cAMP-binding protein